MIQYINGELTVFAAQLGVVTKAPSYDRHITKLNSYLNVAATTLSPVELEGERFSPPGAGSGMIGLPGDFTPPSRFVRTAAFNQTAGGYDTVREVHPILDNFSFPIGAAEGSSGSGET